MNFRKQHSIEPTPMQLAPLVDVLFLLVIFFAVTFQYAKEEQVVDVSLPAADSGKENESRTVGEIIINIKKDGEVVVNGQTYTTDELLAKVKNIIVLAGTNEQAVIIRGETRPPTGNMASASWMPARRPASTTSPSPSKSPRARPPLPDAKLEAHLDPGNTTATLATKLQGEPLVAGRAAARIAGKDLLTRKGDLGDPAVDVKLELPKTKLTTLSPVAPDGAVLGTIAVQGHVKNPEFAVHLEGEGLRTLSGKPAPTTLDAKGTRDEIRASIGVGTGVTVTAKVPPRAYLEAKKGEGLVPISVAIAAPKQKLVDVLPHVARRSSRGPSTVSSRRPARSSAASACSSRDAAARRLVGAAARPVSAMRARPNTAPCSDERKTIASSTFQVRNAPTIATRNLSPAPIASLRKANHPKISKSRNARNPKTTPSAEAITASSPSGICISTPSAMPGNVSSNGRIHSSASMTISGMTTIRKNAIAGASGHVHPKRTRAARNSTAVSSSTSGYWIEIGALQLLHRARSASHEKRGMFSYHLRAWPHLGHFDPGRTMLCPSGTRAMTTFRKLPMARPVTPSQTASSQSMKPTSRAVSPVASGLETFCVGSCARAMTPRAERTAVGGLAVLHAVLGLALVDVLVIDSTYGDRTHDDAAEAEEHIRAVVQRTLDRGGKVLIPSFALERAQEIIYHLSALMVAGRLPKVDVILDSPMASAVSKMNLEKLVADDFSVQASIADVQKNSRLVAEEARRGGIVSPLIEECYRLFSETLAGGHGGLDMIGVLRAIEGRKR